MCEAGVVGGYVGAGGARMYDKMNGCVNSLITRWNEIKTVVNQQRHYENNVVYSTITLKRIISNKSLPFHT